METIYDILSKEHQIVFGMFEEAMNKGSKAALFRIKAEIDPHMAGDEKFFYPRLEEKEESIDIARKAYTEHNEARALMYEMEGMQEGNENWAAGLNELKETIKHHIEDEEKSVFKISREVLSQDQILEITKDYLGYKKDYKANIETRGSLA